MDSESEFLFPENAMKHVLRYVRFDQRASIFLHTPALREIEITVPLHLDYFHFEDLSLCIDTVFFDFYEFWNFPVPSPPSKKEVERIYDQKHFGNLFFRKIDLSGRWEKKVPLELTQGVAEQKLINFLLGRFEKIRIRRLKIDDVVDFSKRIGKNFKGKFLVEELHLKIQNFSEYRKISDFLHLESFPLKKLEFEMENLEDFELDKLDNNENLKLKILPPILESDVVKLLKNFLDLNFEGKLTLEVPEESFLHSIFHFLEGRFGTLIKLGNSTIISINQNSKLKFFGGQVETFKNHIYDICEKWNMWIFEMEILKDEYQRYTQGETRSIANLADI